MTIPYGVQTSVPGVINYPGRFQVLPALGEALRQYQQMQLALEERDFQRETGATNRAVDLVKGGFAEPESLQPIAGTRQLPASTRVRKPPAQTVEETGLAALQAGLMPDASPVSKARAMQILGIATEDEFTRMQADGSIAQVVLNHLSGRPTTAGQRATAGVVSEPVAAARESAATAGANLETDDARVRQQFIQSVWGDLAQDTDLQTRAANLFFGDMNTLLERIRQQGENTRFSMGLDRSRVELVKQAISGSQIAYRAAIQAWDRAKAAHIATFTEGIIGFALKTPQEQNQIIENAGREYERINPRPNQEQFFEENASMYGIDVQDIKTGIRNIISGESRTDVRRPGAQTPMSFEDYKRQLMRSKPENEPTPPDSVIRPLYDEYIRTFTPKDEPTRSRPAGSPAARINLNMNSNTRVPVEAFLVPNAVGGPTSVLPSTRQP